MAALDGTSSTRLLTSQTTHENPSSNNGKAAREFVVVLVLTPDRDERTEMKMRGIANTARERSILYTYLKYCKPSDF
jgi:hypothetical protein